MTRCLACGQSCACGLLSRAAHSPWLLDRVVDGYTRDGPHDPATCVCPACHRWRVETADANALLARWADHDEEPEATTVPLLKQRPKTEPTQDDTTVPCPACGQARSAPPSPGKAADEATLRQPDPWPLCTTCQAVLDLAGGDSGRARVGLLAEVLGVDLSADDPAAQQAARMLRTAAQDDTHSRPGMRADGPPRRFPKGSGSSQRWEHLTTEDRDSLRAALAAARAERRPKLCSDGPCGGCGTRLAVTWHGPVQMSAGTTQGSGSYWPLCGPCDRLLERAGGSALNSTWRSWVTAAALGLDRAVMGLDVVKPYCEYAATGPTEAPGVETPWSYLGGKDRQRIWAAYPRTAPPEVRERRARAERAAALVAATAPTGPRSAVDLGPAEQHR